MFFFTKKDKSNLDLSWVHADMHSHLIPGIDDGSQDDETSLTLIKGLANLGYKKLITTPHVLSEMYPNTSDTILKGLEQLTSICKNENISIELKAAAEYFIDEFFEEELRNKKQFLTISGNMVLVEFSMITAPMDLQQILFEMQIQNYQPVIAHPERYIYLSRNKEFYEELKNSGCQFQLNLLSLTGYYGDSVQELAEYLIRKNLYDYAGTDLHNSRQLSLFQKLSSSVALKKLKESGMIKNHLL
ncbi:MAG TPA: CpsB/CapC family capsule biosynthesis tyrosine phosphatase [Flavisolibacter sp.]|nr:CpsB/CapC family capsule biosynthesis tyrosine phosphatase [Flavisolibacter sp.]